MYGEHWNTSGLGSCCFDKIINQSSPSFPYELMFSGTLIFLSWSVFDICTPFLKLACKMEHSKLAENLTVTRNVISTCILDKHGQYYIPKQDLLFLWMLHAPDCVMWSYFLCLQPNNSKSYIWGLLPESIAFSWSCWFLGYSSLPQPFWILVLSLRSPHLSQPQVAFFFFFKLVLTLPSPKSFANDTERLL